MGNSKGKNNKVKQRNKERRLKEKREKQKKVLKKTAIVVIIVSIVLLPLSIGTVTYRNYEKLANSSGAYGYEKIEMGSYPQTLVEDDTTVAALTQKPLAWKYFEDCCSGDGFYGTMEQTNCMKYADVELDGEQYRAVLIERYRPDSTLSSAIAEESRQDDNGFALNKVYWFRFEPIQWIVLNGNLRFALSEKVLDAMPFNNSFYWVDRNLDQAPDIDRELSSTKYLFTPANLYKTSSIRKWLNTDFFSMAFSKEEQKAIKRAGHLSNESSERKRYGWLALNYDKVFLPSYTDMLKYNDRERSSPITDYARCRGAFCTPDQGTYYSWHWLSSPGDYCADVLSLYANGLVNFDRQFFYANAVGGIRCAMYLKKS